MSGKPGFNAKPPVLSLDAFVCTAHQHPKTGKPYVGVSTPPDGFASGLPIKTQPIPPASPKALPIHTASQSARLPLKSFSGPSSTPVCTASSSTSSTSSPAVAVVASHSHSHSYSSSSSSSSSTSSSSSVTVASSHAHSHSMNTPATPATPATPPSSASASASMKKWIPPPTPPPRKESVREVKDAISSTSTEDPPPPDDDDDDDEDRIYCEVCTGNERHLATHRCLKCELDMCSGKAGVHKIANPTHEMDCFEDLKAQELARYRVLFATPEFSMSKLYVEVLWDDPEQPQDGELPMRKNDVLEVLTDKNETEEWWYGVKTANRSIEGLFPCNYVKKLDLRKISRTLESRPPMAPSSASMRTAKVAIKTGPTVSPSTLAASASMAMAKSAARPASPAKATGTEKQASAATKCHIPVIALQEFKQTAPGTYLSFAKGEKLTIINKKSDKWWWAQNSKGSKGWVPANFMQPE